MLADLKLQEESYLLENYLKKYWSSFIEQVVVVRKSYYQHVLPTCFDTITVAINLVIDDPRFKERSMQG